MASQVNRGVLLAAIGAALLVIITVIAMRPPSPLARDAPPTLFSAGRAFDNLQDLVGDGVPHPIGSAANIKVRDLIVGKLAALGYEVTQQSGWVCNPRSGCGHPTNIVATLPGSGYIDSAILLAAHYDSVGAGPGASDDGVGVAAALEIARIISAAGAAATRHPIVILISDGEEAGLLGASLFVRDHPLAKRIKAAVNMDSRGTSGLSLMFETGSANSWLMHLYSGAIEHPMTNSLYYVIYKLLPSDTDFSVFKAAGYQGFNFAFIGNAAFYHTPLDNLSHTSLTTIQDQGGNALQAVRALAQVSDLNPPVAESVFFDVLRRFLVVWPANMIPALTFGLLLVSFGVTAILVRRGQVRPRQIGLGLIGFFANLLLGGALSAAALALLFALGKVPPFFAGPWLAHPAPMSTAAVAVSIFAAGCISIWLAKRAGFWGLWSGAVLGMSALSVAIALLNPGPAFPWLLTTLAALLGVAPAIAAAKSDNVLRWQMECAALLPAFTLFGVLLPMLLLLYQGLGALAWPAISAALCMVLAFLLPLLAIASSRLRQSTAIWNGGLAVACILITLLLPTFSTQWPQRLNVEYWLDADTHQAHWWVAPGSLRLPSEMAGAANFDSTPTPRFPGTSQLGFSAPAEMIDAEAPHLDIVSTSGTHKELRLRSMREAATAFVIFPAEAQIKEALLSTDAGPLPARLQKLGSGATVLFIRNLPRQGLVFSIDGAPPLRAQVLDESPGLPGNLQQGNALQSSRPQNATSTQDGDVTVLGRTVR
jgi:Zn-dependent M28 family amino/carboxypeptidase